MFLPFHSGFHDLPYPRLTHISPVSQLAAAPLKLPKDLGLFCNGRSRLWLAKRKGLEKGELQQTLFFLF